MHDQNNLAAVDDVPNRQQFRSRLTPAVGLGVLVVLVVLIGGYIFIATLLGIQNFWAGFLFLLYWAGIQEMDFKKLPSTIGGGFFGILLVYLSQDLGWWLGAAESGQIAFVGILLVVIYCQVMGAFAYFINNMTMVYLTVGTIPAVQQGVASVEIAAALALAIAYFSGLVWLAKTVAAMKSKSR